MITLQPKLESLEFQSIVHQVKGLIYMNYNADAMESFITERGIEGDMGEKDQYMAESIDWFLKNSLGKKIILVAHNAHIQKTPVDFDGFISCYPMGQRLSMTFGEKYKAFAIIYVEKLRHCILIMIINLALGLINFHLIFQSRILLNLLCKNLEEKNAVY